MRQLEDIHLDKYIVSVDLMEHVTAPALALTHDDSSVTFYETKTMTIFNGLDDANTVNCLAQAGFQYPIDTPGTSTARSARLSTESGIDSNRPFYRVLSKLLRRSGIGQRGTASIEMDGTHVRIQWWSLR